MPKRSIRVSALQVVGAYFLVACAWIVLSDRLAARLVSSAPDLARISQFKGLAFVAVTTILLYVALSRRLAILQRSQQAVEESERRFAAFMENLPVAAFLRDRKGRYVYANRYWVEQFSKGEPWLGRTPDALFEKRIIEVADADQARILAGESLVERITRLAVQGEDRDFLVRRFPVPSGEDVLVGAFAVDITEQRKLEEQLRQAAKMEAIGHLAGGIAHDFNNLLTVISGYAQLLSRGLPESATAVRGVSEIIKASERATLLTSQLLVFSRKQIVRPVPLDLNSSIEALLSVVDRLVGEKIRIERALDSNLTAIVADRGQIDQVLLNLILNARDAMPNGGPIRISTGNVVLDGVDSARLAVPSGPYVRLSVVDEGHGMDDATRARIFEPFFTTKPPGKGTGLGLSTVYGIVQSCRGSIDLHSAPGKGTDFRIYLPSDGFAPTTRFQSESLALGSGQILLVEDDIAVRSVSRQLMEACGYLVVEAPSGTAALELYANGTYQLVVSDITMPDIDGPELVRRLRARKPDLRALFLTGYTGSIDGSPLDLGGAPVLTKPFTLESLAAAIRKAMQAPESSRPPDI